MDTKFFQSGILKIVAVHSNKVLDIDGSNSSKDGAKLQQWGWLNGSNQKFMIFSTDDVGRYFVIASMASGKVLDIPDSGKYEGAVVVQRAFTGNDTQLFELEKVPHKSDTYFIRSKQSGRVLNVSGVRTDDSAPILEYSLSLSGDQAGNVQFKFEKVAELKDIQDVLEQVPVSPAFEFPELSSPQKPQSAREWKMVGKPFVLPYFMVQDNNSYWQINESPYYLLTREVCYTLNDEYFSYNNTASEQEYEVTVVAGFTTEESTSFSRNTGLEVSGTIEHKVGAEAGAEVGVASAKVSTETSISFTASASLSLGYSTSTALSRHSETAIRRLVKCPAYTSLAVWNQTSKFTLTRLDKTILKRWEVPEGGIFIDDFKIPQ
jgi:Insecticidal Crystal Toxin, P42/Ricin-type beta-trefoil lectin domain-like